MRELVVIPGLCCCCTGFLAAGEAEDQQLVNAVYRNDLAGVKAALQAGADPNLRGPDQAPPFFYDQQQIGVGSYPPNNLGIYDLGGLRMLRILAEPSAPFQAAAATGEPRGKLQYRADRFEGDSSIYPAFTGSNTGPRGKELEFSFKAGFPAGEPDIILREYASNTNLIYQKRYTAEGPELQTSYTYNTSGYLVKEETREADKVSSTRYAGEHRSILQSKRSRQQHPGSSTTL